jgi:general L-amino acid transport system permease protein
MARPEDTRPVETASPMRERTVESSDGGDRAPDSRDRGRAAAVEPGIVGQLAYVRGEEEPVLPPPRGNIGIVGWVRKNLFSSVTNTVLTVLGIVLIVLVVPPIVEWAVINAVWTGDSREACIAPGAGACWAFVEAKFGQFIYGRYPIDQRWRVDVTAIMLIIGIVLMAVPRIPYKRETAIYLFVVFPIAALILLTGGHFDIVGWVLPTLLLVGCFATAIVAMIVARGASPLMAGTVAPAAIGVALLVFLGGFFIGIPAVVIGSMTVAVDTIALAVCGIVAVVAGVLAIFGSKGFPGGRAVLAAWIVLAALALLVVLFSLDLGLLYVETPLWGGLLVTLVVALTGMGASMPLGIALALGRRSGWPVVRFVSIGFIEFVRGVPLITVLFMASVMLPLFLPPGVNFDKLLRALIGVAVFEAAYMAEVVRGGLQAIPAGQYEAAKAVGLNYWQSMRLIILPQALRIVIPGIVNSFISLFKDTSLVLIIGIFDLLGIVQSNFTDANWASPATPATGYVFAAIVFWMFCFGMSRYSIYTERRLGTGYRR